MSGQSKRTAIEKACADRGLRMTEQRRTVARILSAATDHPDVDELYRRARADDERISLATVYRTIRLFEDEGIIERHDFGDGRSRFENAERAHHDHLIDMETGRVIEFHDAEIERLQEKVALRLGYKIVGHRLELFCEPIDGKKD